MERREGMKRGEGMEGKEGKEGKGQKGRKGRKGGRGELDACPGAQGHPGSCDCSGASHGRPILLPIDSLGPSIWCPRKGMK